MIRLHQIYLHHYAMNEAMIQWGIIGCGDVTEVKSGPAFSRATTSCLYAVMRRDAEKAEDYARRHHVPVFYSSVNDLLEDTNINAVYIATPPSSHKDLAILALKKNLNVYIEKPIGLNAHECEQIMEALKISRSKLCVAHYRRQLPFFLYIKKVLDDQQIGLVRHCSIRLHQPSTPNTTNWRLNPAISGGGLFHDLAPHQLDILIYFFKRVISMSGFAVNQSSQVPDVINGIAMFEGGVSFSGSWCFCADESDTIDECCIIGTHGNIRFNFFGSIGKVTINKASSGEDESEVDIEGRIKRQQSTVEYIHPRFIQYPMINEVCQYFFDASKKINPCSIEDALSVMQMIDCFSGSIFSAGV
jgi:predicted dehydrogenase